ncbi:MAG: tRNA modification GTPase MnmE [Phycisphaerae bacterium]|nr:tRNA modification GTPase MnmE [Phycisphaerae bacterium]
MFDRLDETIVAISTPPGKSVRGVVRLSGPEAHAVAGQLFTDNELLPENTRFPQRRHGVLQLCSVPASGGVRSAALPAERWLFYAPRSYTRQHVAELHTLGAPALLQLVVEQCCQLGARLAQPGEFTARAFFNGALDLTRAEGVAAMIHARNTAQLRVARAWLGGRLADRFQSIHQRLIDLVALVEADIDFADEPIEFITPAQLQEQLHTIINDLEQWLGRAQSSERVAPGLRAMLVGRPNAGKSTLLNALHGSPRAISSPQPGTTRDLLSVRLSLDCGELELLDSAGWDMTTAPQDQPGKNFFFREWQRADLLIYLLDISIDNPEAHLLDWILRDARPVMLLANKCDLLTTERCTVILQQLQARSTHSLLLISAEQGIGLGAVRSWLSQTIIHAAQTVDDNGLILNARHRDALQQALPALYQASRWCQSATAIADVAEWIATDLRAALHMLGLISGSITTEDLLQRIFTQFCIGK